jgi:sporulation protein YlmC with PRC-barrel domain
VKVLINVEKIKGKKVFTYRGMLMGEVDAVQIDENNWTIAEVDVALDKEMEKLFDVKSGMMSKTIVPVQISMMGPIGPDSIALKEEIQNPKEYLEKASSERQRIIHR